MFDRIRRHLSYANVTASLALFLALGGVGYAAATLPKNSVTAKAIKNGAVTGPKLAKNAVTSTKVKDGSLRKQDFAAGQLPAGAQGATGAQGPKGDKGDRGDAGPITGTLPSGVTLKGQYAIRVSNSIAGQRIQTAISFGLQLPSAPTQHYIQDGAAPPAECPGTKDDPKAAPGHLCVYEYAVTNITAGTQTIFDHTGVANTADVYGAGIAANATNGAAGAPADTRLRGVWAVTAP